LIEWFGLENVGKSPARFDFAKLESLNGHYIRHMPDGKLLEQFLRFLPHVEGGAATLEKIDDVMEKKLLKAMPGLKERAKTLVELLKGAEFLFASRPLALDDKARQIIAEGGAQVLKQLIPLLASSGVWTAPALETVVKAHAEATGQKLGKLAQPLRAALTGATTSPGIFDVLEVLGQAESLARLQDQVS
jgi:glutamyl-tRNA synthetase